MSGRRGSNPRPIAWKAIALPTELLPHLEVRGTNDEVRIFASLASPPCSSNISNNGGVCNCIRLWRTTSHLTRDELLPHSKYEGRMMKYEHCCTAFAFIMLNSPFKLWGN